MRKLILIPLLFIGCADKIQPVTNQPATKDEKGAPQENHAGGSNWWLWYWLGTQSGGSNHTTHTPSNNISSGNHYNSSKNHIQSQPYKAPVKPSSKPHIPTFGKPRPSSSFSKPSYRPSSSSYRSGGFRSSSRR